MVVEPQQSAIVVETINPTNGTTAVTGELRERTLKFESHVERRGKCSFTLFSPGYPVERGDEVRIYLNGSLTWAGSIERVEHASLESDFESFEIKVSGVSNDELADRHLHAASYIDPDPLNPTQNVGDIVKSILSDELAQDGVTEGEIQDGPTFAAANFNYVTVSRALDTLARQVGFLWKINVDKTLDFVARENFTAPWDISPTNRAYQRASLRSDRRDYRNVQYVRGGKTKTDIEEEQQFQGDGENQTFGLRLDVAELPRVYVNRSLAGFQEETVGLQGVDDSDLFEWFYEVGSPDISQRAQDEALTANDILRVVYTGFLPILTILSDTEEVEARAIEGAGGTSGVYEQIETDESIDDLILAEFKAEGLLRAYGTFQELLNVTTWELGIEAGQLQNVELPEFGVNESFLVTSASYSDVGNNYIRCQYKAITGENIGGWPEFFRRLRETGTEFTIRENDSFLIGRRIDGAASGTIYATDSLTVDQSDTLIDWTQDFYSYLFIGTVSIGMTEIGEPTYP